MRSACVLAHRHYGLLPETPEMACGEGDTGNKAICSFWPALGVSVATGSRVRDVEGRTATRRSPFVERSPRTGLPPDCLVHDPTGPTCLFRFEPPPLAPPPGRLFCRPEAAPDESLGSKDLSTSISPSTGEPKSSKPSGSNSAYASYSLRISPVSRSTRGGLFSEIANR